MCVFIKASDKTEVVGYKIAVKLKNKSTGKYVYRSPFTGIQYKPGKIPLVTRETNNPLLPSGINRVAAIEPDDYRGAYNKNVVGYTGVFHDYADAITVKAHMLSYRANQAVKLVILKLTLVATPDSPLLVTEMSYADGIFRTMAGKVITKMVICRKSRSKK